jgi:transposase
LQSLKKFLLNKKPSHGNHSGYGRKYGTHYQEMFSKHHSCYRPFSRSKTSHRSFTRNQNQYRWQAIDQENEAIEAAKKSKKRFEPEVLTNGDTLKQLLARSRYFLYKNKSKWSQNQLERANLLFELYPDIQKAYNLTQDLRNIFEKTTDKIIGFAKLAKWHEKVNQSAFKSFNTISRTIINHYQTILNYFDNRSTNASAESFNTKIKTFRSQFRGVRNIEFFLFRLTNIYA